MVEEEVILILSQRIRPIAQTLRATATSTTEMSQEDPVLVHPVIMPLVWIHFQLEYNNMEAQRGRNNSNLLRGGRGGRNINRGGSCGGRFASMYGGGFSSPRECSLPDATFTNTNSTARSYSWC